MDIVLLIDSILLRALIAGTPFLLATLGEVYSERSGIMNLGIEGILATGAVAGFAITYITGSPALGFICAGLAGLAFAAIHAFITLSLKANQVVSGLAITMLGLGFSGVFGKDFIGLPLTSVVNRIEIPLLKNIPVLGPTIFSMDPVFYISVLIAIIMWFIMFKTRYGIIVRSIGENPEAAYAAGVRVMKTQYACVLIGGFLSGIAGGYLSLVYIPSWMEGMSGGRGWIVISLTILSGWNPLKAIFASFLFGGVYVLQYYLQPYGISPNLLNMFPYIAVLFILLLSINSTVRRNLNAPEWLGKNFSKE